MTRCENTGILGVLTRLKFSHSLASVGALPAHRQGQPRAVHGCPCAVKNYLLVSALREPVNPLEQETLTLHRVKWGHLQERRVHSGQKGAEGKTALTVFHHAA